MHQVVLDHKTQRDGLVGPDSAREVERRLRNAPDHVRELVIIVQPPPEAVGRDASSAERIREYHPRTSCNDVRTV